MPDRFFIAWFTFIAVLAVAQLGFVAWAIYRVVIWLTA